MRRWLKVAQQVAQIWQKYRVSRVAAALSFYMIFSVAPLVVVLTYLTKLISAHTDALRIVDSYAGFLFGSKIAQGIQTLVQASERKIVSTPIAIGAVLLLVAIGGVFLQVQEALDDIWDIPQHRRGRLHEKVVHRLHLVIVIGVLALLGLLAVFAAVTTERLSALVVNVLAVAAFLMITYREMPREDVGWRGAAIGAIITASILLLGEAIVSFYFVHFHPETGFGNAGSYILILLWLYYSAQLFLFGAVLTRVLEPPRPENRRLKAAKKKESR